MNWEIAYNNHIGGREEQQDRIATFSTADNQQHLLVAADGMGGHQGGSLASEMVIKTAELAWQQFTDEDIPQFLQNIIEQAHENINNIGKKYNISPRSTCVLAYIKDQYIWWAHLGDSRLYHFRGTKLLKRTKDHSIVQLLHDLGRIKEEQMATHPDQGSLLKGLGGEDEDIQADFGEAKLHPGDSIVLCTDGFWEHITTEQLATSLQQTKKPLKPRIQQLVTDALKNGGAEGDNISIIVAQSQKKGFFAALFGINTK
jgi:serine/threonine protein phosphatase PrpC